VKVGRVEFACLLQLVPIGDLHLCSPGLDQAIGPQLLENPVDVNVRDADRIGELALGDRQVTDMVLGQTGQPP
jgi:hypothetical protein